jgi:hypothetical protein
MTGDAPSVQERTGLRRWVILACAVEAMAQPHMGLIARSVSRTLS